MRFTTSLPRLAAAIAVIGIWACTDSSSPSPSPEAEPLFHHKPDHGGGSGGDDGGGDAARPANATYRDDVLDGFLSDGRGTYTTASIGDYFTLDVKAGTTPRQFCFNFHGQLSADQVGFSDEPDSDVHCDDGYVTTGVSTFQEDNVTPGVPLDEMSVGSVQRARFGGVYVREGYNWGFKYGRDCDFVDIPDERAVITRVSDTEWTIEATTLTLCRSAVRGSPQNDGLVAEGLNMPVKVTATLQ